MKRYLLGLLALAPLLAHAQATPPHPYLIRGQIGKLNAPAKVYLVGGAGRLDSATLKNGQFEFKGATPQPGPAALVLGRQGRFLDGWQRKMLGGKMETVYVEYRDRHQIFLEPGPIVLTGTDSLRTAHLTGGPLTADYQRLTTSTQSILHKLTGGAKSQEEAATAFKDYRQAFLNFAQANPASWVGLFAMQQYSMMGPVSYAEATPVYAAFSPELRTSEPGQQYGAMLESLKATAIGATAPDFTQADATGKPVKLSDYRGKFVLVDFWASWCVPCRAENPNVLAAYNSFKDKNFAILGVSIDSNQEKWLKAVAEDKLPWPQVSDLKRENEAAQRYNVQTIPQNFLIDPSGKIIAANLRGPELAATLARLLH